MIARCLEEALGTGGMIVQEFQVKAADGRVLWLESRGQAVFEDGKPTHVRGMTIDIGRRKKNEEALVASEARYRVLADLNPQAIWMGAPDGSVVYANQNLLDYIGLSFETIAQKGLLRCFHPDDHAQILEAWRRSIATGSEYSIEARMIRATDGVPRWWWLRAQAIRDESGKVLNWLGVAIDIDDSKTFAETLQQRQEETERQRAELETIYQTAPVGLGLFDPVEFRYIRINDRLAEIIGLPPEQILRRPVSDVAPVAVHAIFEQVLATRTMQHRLIEGEFAGRPGETHFFNVNYAPVFALDGSIQGIATATLDITQQKKAEAALIQSEKLAAVGRLASSISHEINNPLEAITNLLYIIGEASDLPESLKLYVRTAQDELSRVCQIATQTLRFHRRAVKATRINAADLVNSVLTLYQGRLTNSNILVDASYATSKIVLCFENDMRQVLNNLIANAIDAMRQNGGRLIVRAHDAVSRSPTNAQGTRGIRITIADTGHGMSNAVQAHLFEPFYTTKDLNGTGLGLWISAGIVTRHQGRLSFRSSEHPVHHGTIFSLFLPWAEVTEETLL
jgi:PAS domain S-box-containing protein